MNKLYKCALGLFTTFILSFACFSNAVEFPTNAWDGATDLNSNGYRVTNQSVNNSSATYYTLRSDVQFVCMRCPTSSCSNRQYSFDGNNWSNLSFYSFMCTNKPFYTKGGEVFIFPILKEWYILPEQYNSLQCQTEYNLIPISEVTPNYCKLNFNMIDPQECPVNSGTGTIVRSNLMINDIPYAQNQNINVFIPDFLSWNIAFNDFNTVIEVEGYNADEEYIENVINQEKLTPTNKDIEDMLTGFMTNYFPYLALAIVFLYLARKIFKLFK